MAVGDDGPLVDGGEHEADDQGDAEVRRRFRV